MALSEKVSVSVTVSVPLAEALSDLVGTGVVSVCLVLDSLSVEEALSDPVSDGVCWGVEVRDAVDESSSESERESDVVGGGVIVLVGVLSKENVDVTLPLGVGVAPLPVADSPALEL